LNFRTSNTFVHRRTALALMSLALALSSCATEQPSAPAPAAEPTVTAPPPPPAPTRRTTSNGAKGVRASYQGNAQIGRRTASGEIYDPNELTAASRTLPLGSSVVVTNPSTGRSVKVRINDRGPFVGGRSLDLSKRAADEIGLTGKGVGRVKIKRVAKTETSIDSKSKTNADSEPAAKSKPAPSVPSGVTPISTSIPDAPSDH
jgi:rare lipoprotein A